MGAVIRPIRRLALAGAAAALTLAALGVPMVAAADVTFGAASASSDFGKDLTFSQPIEVGSSTVTRTELLLLFPGALGPALLDVPVKSTLDSGAHELQFVWDPTTDGHIVPNTMITATWRLTSADGTVVEGPPLRYRYRDDRFPWKTDEGTLVRLHWYDGDTSFANQALSIAEAGVRQAEQVLGVTENEPIDFFVYADKTAFYDALGPGTPENVGGEAHADIRTMFALITPSMVNDAWLKDVLPHELTHLVFNSAVDNPYHAPPKWLNEGLAVYLSVGYTSSYRALVAGAAADGSLAPLSSLSLGFPGGDRFFLAYGEGVSAIDYLVRTYGNSALVKLIRSYAQGLTDDEAFKATLGVDVAGFDAGWRADLGAKPMASLGPRPAPAGPLPSDWSGPGPGTASAAPALESGAPTPGSFVPDISASPAPSGGGTADAGTVIMGVLAVLVGVVVVAAAVYAWGRRSRA